jgi:hypothetical protein
MVISEDDEKFDLDKKNLENIQHDKIGGNGEREKYNERINN